MVRMQKVYDEAQELFMQGKHDEANALLEAAGKDLQEFMAKNYLSERTSLRMQASSMNFLQSAMEPDMNFKLKMLKAEKLRMMRDRRNFRDKDGN